MNRGYIRILWLLLMMLMLPACQKQNQTNETSAMTMAGPSMEAVGSNNETVITATAEATVESGGTQMQTMVIDVGGQSFSAVLEDNDTARAFLERLPMTLSMDELNGNEKYNYMDEGLPANPRKVDSVRAGDIMLFGSDCLVLFFESFNTSYSYTPIGYIEDRAGFSDALGAGAVEVTFR